MGALDSNVKYAGKNYMKILIVRDAKQNIINIFDSSKANEKTRARLVKQAIAMAKDHRGSVDGIWPSPENSKNKST